jgi:hypothetical protein
LYAVNVIEHGEAEWPHVDFAMAKVLAGICSANGRFGVREIGDGVVDHRGFGGKAIHMGLDFVFELTDSPPVVFAGFALGIGLGLADRFADEVGLARQFLDFRLQFAALRLELDEPGDVDVHATAVAVLLDELGVFQDQTLVKHYQILAKCTDCANPIRRRIARWRPGCGGRPGRRHMG